MSETQIYTILRGLKFPEGPVFDFDGNLWFVEIQGGNLAKWEGEKLQRFYVDGTPNGAMIDKSGTIWFCDSGRGEIRKFNTGNKEFTTVCRETTDGNRLKRPNDLIFDSQGNLLFSDHSDGRTEALSSICVLPKGSDKAKIISKDKFFTNGLAFMKDGKTLVFAETYKQQLWTAQWNPEELKLANECHFAKAGKGPWGPDGIAFDVDDNLYVSVFNESRVNIYDKEGGFINWLPVPGSRPTSCAFDPFQKYGFVVTEAERGEIISYQLKNKGLSIYYG